MTYHLTPFVHPETGAWVCPCGQEFVTVLQARGCAHPATGGKIPRMMDTETPEWWTAHDELILRGEVMKLTELWPVQPAVNGQRFYAPITDARVPRRWLQEIGAWAVLALAVLGVLALLSVGGEQQTPPVPRGSVAGFSSVPVAPTPGPYGGP